MTRFISVFLAVSFFISPFSVFAEEVPTTTPLEVPVFLFSDKHDGILGIVPISENSFVFAYATTSEFAEIGFINLARPVEGSAASTNTENPSFTPLGILLVPLNLEFESVSQSLESGAGVGQRIFTSHEYDSHAPTNYSYAEARYLDMTRGRFISEDPSFIYNPEKFLADTQQQNSYAYARNNPIRFVDPDGATIAEAAGGFATNLILAPFVLPLWVASAVFQPAAAWNQVSGAASTLQQNAAAFADNPGATLEATVQSYNNLSDTEKGGLAGIIAATIVVPGIAGKLELGIESDPMLYRTMKMGPDGLPMTGERARTLGVRIGEGKDITQGADGLGHPGTGGMSATPNDPAHMYRD